MPITLDFDEEGEITEEQNNTPEENIENSSESDFFTVVGAQLRENGIYQLWKAIKMGKGESFFVSPTPEEYPRIDLGIELPPDIDPDFNLNETLDHRQVPHEDRSYFEHVRNPEQFETTYDYYLQDKEDEQTLKNAGILQNLGAGVLTFAADPLVYMGLGATNKIGLAVKALRNPVAANALFGGIYSASSYSVKRLADNREFDAQDMAVDTVAGALGGVLLHGMSQGVKKLYSPIKESIKASITPKIDNMFLQEAGVLKKSSSPAIQKAKRFLWEMFNPTPMWQMYNSGNEQLQRLAPKIFGFRTSNLAGKDVINDISISEKLSLYNGDGLKLSEEVYALRDKFIEAGGTGAGFDTEVGLTIAEREIDPNTLVGQAAKKIVDFDNKYVQFGEGELQTERYVLTKELANMPREVFDRKLKENNLKSTLRELVEDLDHGSYNEDYARLIESEEKNITKYLDELGEAWGEGKDIIADKEAFQRTKKEYSEQSKSIRSEISDLRKTIKKAVSSLKRNDRKEDTLVQKVYRAISEGSGNRKSTADKVEQFASLKQENKNILEEIQTAEELIKEKQESIINLVEQKTATKNELSERTSAQKAKVKELKAALRKSNQALGGYFSYLKKQADKNEKLVNKLSEVMSEGSEIENSDVYQNLKGIIRDIATTSEEIRNYRVDTKKVAALNNLRNKLADSIYTDSFGTLTLDTAKRHIKRIYDTEAIDANMDMATELLEREVLLNNPELPESEVTKTVNRIINSVTGDRPSAFRSETASHQPNTSKAREIAVSDEVLLERGFIKYDSVTNHINNIKSELVDQELDKIAVGEGYKGWRDRSIGDDSNPNYLIDDFEIKAQEAGGAERRKTRNEDIGQANKENYSYMLRLLNDTEMLLKGTYSKGGWSENLSNVAFFRGVRDATMCCYSGMLWAAQIPDIAQICMREGFAKPIKRMAPAIFKKDTLSKIERERLYSFLDLLDNSVQATRFVDMGYTPESQRTWLFKPSKDDSLPKRGARKVLTVGIEASNLMTVLLKRNAAQGIYSDLIEACINNRKHLLNRMGINEDQSKIIADLFYKYGDMTKNIKYFDPNNIADVKLRDQIRASVETLTDEIIATPNAGNIPRMLRGPFSFLFMFVSYPFMLFNNVYKPLLRGDISKNLFATSVAASLALSTARKGIVDYLNGKDTNWEEAETWKEVYTYSNLDTHIFDGIEMLWRGISRRDLLGAVSPAYQWMNNIIQVGHQLCRGKWGTRKQRNLLPPFNFGPLRPLTNPYLHDEHRNTF